MSKCYIDLGTNSMGAYKTLIPILGITDEWQKIFVEPNPEHWIFNNIDKKIKLIPNATLIKKAVASENRICDLYTRTDLINHIGDSAATIQSIEFLKNSIGGNFKENPEYTIYPVECITIEDVLKMTGSDELYIKMDIEGEEMPVLENFPLEYLPKIKAFYVEFHAHDDFARQRRDSIINKYSSIGFNFLHWD